MQTCSRLFAPTITSPAIARGFLHWSGPYDRYNQPGQSLALAPVVRGCLPLHFREHRHQPGVRLAERNGPALFADLVSRELGRVRRVRPVLASNDFQHRAATVVGCDHRRDRPTAHWLLQLPISSPRATMSSAGGKAEAPTPALPSRISWRGPCQPLPAAGCISPERRCCVCRTAKSSRKSASMTVWPPSRSWACSRRLLEEWSRCRQAAARPSPLSDRFRVAGRRQQPRDRQGCQAKNTHDAEGPGAHARIE